MSDTEEKNDQLPERDDIPPTASYEGPSIGPGRQIGQFRIERELGRGAMGVVYLAQDTKLGRTVAIKSLSSEVTENPTVRMRFSREARILASLNHAGIAAIYEELEHGEGLGYLVLEYVPGRTLAERIAEGKLELTETLSIALQIAEAMAAAHECDVIHRDLKPGNIKITSDDKVKVLDFGIAKPVKTEVSGESSTVTQPGGCIGTPAYMSPEQARGKPIDKRCDIWAFGCILYEMLTGIVPFEGETISDTMANVLQKEPDWQVLPQNIQTCICTLLRRCLEKDPRRRLRDIGDAAIEIRETLTQSSGVSITNKVSRQGSWKIIALWVAVGLIIGAMIMFFGLQARRKANSDESFAQDGLRSKRVRRFCIDLDPDHPLITTGGRSSPAPSFTHDGRHMVYTAGASGNTWVAIRSMDNLTIRRIEGTDGAIWAAASPGGKWLVFVTVTDTWRIPLTGGSPERLGGTMAFVWENENTLICRPNDTVTRLFRMDIETKQLQPLDFPAKKDVFLIPQPIQFEPGSRTLFYTSLGAQVDDSAVYALSMNTGEHKLIVERAWAAWYVSSGHLVYVQPGRLMVAPFNIDTREITGIAVDVTEERMVTEKSVPSFDFSPDGTLVYVPIGEREDIGRVLVWVDLEGNETPLRTRPMAYRSVSISRNASRPQIVGDMSSEGSIWIYDTGGESPVRPLTFLSEGTCLSPVWVPPEYQEVIFGSASVETGCVLKRKAADGSGQAHEFLSLSNTASDWSIMFPCAFDPNGKVLLTEAVSMRPAQGMDIVSIDMGPSIEVKPLLATENKEHSPALSPDGHWLAFVSDETGRDEVFVTTFPDLESKWHLSVETEGGQSPLWAPDGSVIYYRDGTSVVAVPTETTNGFKYGRARRLFDDVYLSSIDSQDYDIHPSGKQFLMIKKSPDEKSPTEVIIVENWFEELKRLAPPNG